MEYKKLNWNEASETKHVVEGDGVGTRTCIAV